MDAVKFIEEAKRMCNASMGNCAKCNNNRACPINLPSPYYTPEERVKIVEEWAKSHPRKTRQSVFMEQWPNAKVVYDEGVLALYPCVVEKKMQNVRYCNSLSCADCRREFWTQEVE